MTGSNDDQACSDAVADHEDSGVRRADLDFNRDSGAAGPEDGLDLLANRASRLFLERRLDGRVDACLVRKQHPDVECFRKHVTHHERRPNVGGYLITLSERDISVFR